MAEKKNPAIVCCRTASMILIVLCHIIENYTFIPGHQFMPLIFNVGVHSFLLISGYLYGGKNIANWRTWFKKRYVTVAMPAQCMSIITLVLMLITGTRYPVASAILYLVNLQGLGFLVPGVYGYFSEIRVLGPLWFITVIMLCYCLVPLLQKLRDRISGIRHGYLSAAALVAAAFAVYLLSGFNLMYFATFTMGYCMAERKSLKKIGFGKYAAVSGSMLAAQILRLVLRAVCDETPLYQCYTELSQMILGIWILCTFFAASQKFPELIEKLADAKLIAGADRLSFYVYLTHCCFCTGAWNFYAHTDNLLIATVGFLGASIIAAVLLRKIVQRIQRMVM